MNCLSIVGLIIDIVGAIFLFFSTEVLNKMLIEISESNSMISGRGFGIDIYKAKMIHEAQPKKKQANQYSRWGLILIILGFMLQLLGAIFN